MMLAAGAATRSVTWNPSDHNAHAVLSGGNLTATGDNTLWATARTTHGVPSTEKRYWEVQILTDSSKVLVGIADASFSLADNSLIGFGATSAGFGSSTNSVNGGTLSRSYSGTETINVSDIIMFARNGDKMWLGKNGTWYNSGNPATGTGEWLTGLSTTEFFPACSVRVATTAGVALLKSLPSALSHSVPSTFYALGSVI